MSARKFGQNDILSVSIAYEEETKQKFHLPISQHRGFKGPKWGIQSGAFVLQISGQIKLAALAVLSSK